MSITSLFHKVTEFRFKRVVVVVVDGIGPNIGWVKAT